MKVFKIQFNLGDLITDYIVAAKSETEALLILGSSDPLDYLHNIFESAGLPDEEIIEEIDGLEYKGDYPTVLYHFFEWVK